MNPLYYFKNYCHSEVKTKIFVFTFFAFSINIQGQIITTVAGNGTRASITDGVIATTTSLWAPGDIAVDSFGNMFIADTYHNRIRKVNVSNNIITTFAGNGVQSFYGDGGIATSAAMNHPFSMFVKSAGEVFIADSYNAHIRKVSGGIINTVAGYGVGSGYNGDNILAINARISGGQNNYVDINGNIYIADGINSRVRKVDASTGVITTIAGTGLQGNSGDGGLAINATFGDVIAVCLDRNGNIYIADQLFHTIRKINLSTGIITRICGNGVAGFFGDNGLALNAELNAPTDLCIDEGGNLFIADQLNGRVRRIDAISGIITTVAGNGSDSSVFSGDGGDPLNAALGGVTGICIDLQGNLFIACQSADRVRKVSNINRLPGYLPLHGLVAWYPFNGNAQDISGNNNHLAITGAKLTPDRSGNINSAYKFSGAQYLSGDCSRLPSGSRSISVWYAAKKLGSNTIGKNFLGYGGGGSPYCGSSWISIFENPDYSSVGTLEIQGHCNNFMSFIKYPKPANNAWHNIVITYDGNKTTYYNDGVMTLSVNQIITPTYISSKKIFIGTVPATDGVTPFFTSLYQGFNGNIDDVGIWNRALTAQEVMQVFTGTSPASQPPLYVMLDK